MRRLLVISALAAGLFAWSTASSATTTTNHFLTHCSFFPQFDRAQVDPIVSHGQPQSAHMHDFYGTHYPNPNTAANSQLPADEPAGQFDPGYSPVSTGCNGYGDWASYWMPTAKVSTNGVAAYTPTATASGDPPPNSGLTNHWLAPAGVRVGAPPYGMAVVAGDSHATSAAGESPMVSWTCGGLSPSFRKPSNCAGVPGGIVTGVIRFPDCWNGQHGWGVDGWDGHSPPMFDAVYGISQANFAYSPCPAGFHLIAQLVTEQHFSNSTNGPLVNPLTSAGVERLTFSSGPYWTYHGDDFITWNIGLKELVDVCLNGDPNPPPGVNPIDCSDSAR